MRVKILGARQGESLHSHFTSIVLDGVLALDAGSLTGGLTLQEQSAVRSILLTHHHFDHIKDLASFGFNCLVAGNRARIYCTDGVRRALAATILSKEIWLDFFSVPDPHSPTFEHFPVEPDRPFELDGYRIHPIAVRHSIAALGFEITGHAGERVLYTGDSGPGSGAQWALTTPDLIITEVTYRNADDQLAKAHGHLSSSLLAEELTVFRGLKSYLPKVAVVHVNPYHETQIAIEVADIGRTLGNEIWLPQEGDIIVV